MVIHELKPDELSDDGWKFFPLDYDKPGKFDSSLRPWDQAESDAFKALIDEGQPYVTRRNETDGTFEYYEPVVSGERCQTCHQASGEGRKFIANKKGVFGVAKISFSLQQTDSQIGYNMGILWVAMEAATLSTVLLVTLYRTPASLEAGWKYFVLCGVGIAQALFGTILLYFASEKILGAEGMGALLWTELNTVKGQLEPTVLSLAFVFLLLGYHHACGRLLKKFERGANTRGHVFYRWFNEVPVLMLLAITILVVVKPF